MYDRWGQGEQALDYYQQALPIRREVGDRAGEAVTRFNLAMVYRGQGQLDRAVAELEQVVELDRQIGHPDLESDTATLEQVRQDYVRSGRAPGLRVRSEIVATASIEVSGPDAEALARELRAVMAGAAREGETVSAVEVDRSPELVIAVIGLVFNGVSTARTLWDWWQARRPKGVTVRILLRQ